MSENESYQIGSNPVKEEPIIKFYSKISSCRNDIVEDKHRRITVCIACGEQDRISNSEIHDIVDRKSFRTALLLGRTHYTEYREWFKDEQYKIYALVPEIVIEFAHDRSYLTHHKSLMRNWRVGRNIKYRR